MTDLATGSVVRVVRPTRIVDILSPGLIEGRILLAGPPGPPGAGDVPASRQVATGTGLTGGGNLSADRTLAVVFGAAAGTVAEGNDARLSDARTPLAHSHPKADVGLANVDNTSDANKPVSTAQQTALDLKANRASPALTGVPTSPTATAGTNNNQIATTAFVSTAVAAVPPAPVSSVAGKTGAVSLVKADVGLANVDNTSDASKPVSTATQTALNAKAPLASPALTGTPTAPTAAAGTNSTQLATTAFVQALTGSVSAFGRTLIDDANNTAARTTLDVYSKAEVNGLGIQGSAMGSIILTTSPAVLAATNAAAGTASGRIAGMSVTVVGEGKAVIVRSILPSCRNTTASVGTNQFNPWIAQGTTAVQQFAKAFEFANGTSPQTVGTHVTIEGTTGILTAGVSYTFYTGIRVAIGATQNITLDAVPGIQMEMKVMRT